MNRIITTCELYDNNPRHELPCGKRAVSAIIHKNLHTEGYHGTGVCKKHLGQLKREGYFDPKIRRFV